MEMRVRYRELFCENMEYELLCESYDRARLDELLALLVDTVCTRRKQLHIAGGEVPADTVRSRLLTLNDAHIAYVLDCLDANTTRIRNIKAYLLAALYNAPMTMDSYYRAAVNHDMNRRE